jgi:hypothetical protein
MQKTWGRIAARFIAMMVVAGAAPAAAADWSVSQMSGQVTIAAAGAQPVALKRDAVLPAGGILRTGAASRALLVRNAETISVGPNAAIAVPPGGNNPEFTTILQNGGLVAFNVDKRNVQHFSVETPYLAAVVKGTEFSVEVAPDVATVRVTRGVVEVTALANGYVIALTAGQAATVKADGSLAVAGVSGRPQVTQGVPRRPIVEGTSMAALQRALNLNVGIGTSASLGGGRLTLGAQLGAGASVGATGGGLDLGASGGGDVLAGPASVSVGGGGVTVEAAGLAAGVGSGSGSGGIEVSAGSAAVSVGGGGVHVDIDPPGLGPGLGLGLGH